MELKCQVQQYAWGKLGQNSQVAKYGRTACKDFALDESKPYAELWMGVHPNGPSVVAESGESLAEYIRKNPSCLGEKVGKQFSNQLPFLFKVLSVNKALSIQAHPAKDHAETLHAQRPQVYKDANHKPEIAIALTKFEGLCGFRPLDEIQKFVTHLPELQAVIGLQATEDLLASTPTDYQTALKAAFKSLMESDKEIIGQQLNILCKRISSNTEKNLENDLFVQLNADFPGDVGCFVIYFLNRVSLNPGESMYLGPNVPHAYLSGDCVECMANSDNVVRAGLTPKLIDVETLVGMLEYKCGPAEERKYVGEAFPDGSGTKFNPSVPDFAVNRIEVAGSADCYTAPVQDSASILLVTRGKGKFLASNQVIKEGGFTVVQPYASDDIQEGSVLFLPANKIVELFPEDCDQLIIHQAFCCL